MSEVPYTPPPPPPPPAPPVEPPSTPPPKPAFDFAKPFTFVFEDPDWLKKILLGGLFYLAGIFIIGIFFILGYIARLTRNVIAGHPRPLPEWDDLGAYFNEGLRLFAIALLGNIVPFFLFFFMFFPAGLLGAIDNEGARAIGSGIMGCLGCLLVPVAFAIMFFLPGCMLFAIVEQRFGAAFELGRIWAFIKLNVGNYLLAFVVYLVASNLAGIGIILFCVGFFVTAFLALLISAHAFAQTYRLATQKA